MNRAEQIARAANQIYRDSRRPRRAIITQVPAASATDDRQTMRSIVVPHKSQPVSWAEARKRAEAYGRVLDGDPELPAYPTKVQFEAAAKDRARQKALAKAARTEKTNRRASRAPGWTDGELAIMDAAIEARIDPAVPSYSRRGRRLAKQAKRLAQKHAEAKETAE